jgi:hypothetical protein
MNLPLHPVMDLTDPAHIATPYVRFILISALQIYRWKCDLSHMCVCFTALRFMKSKIYGPPLYVTFLSLLSLNPS